MSTFDRFELIAATPGKIAKAGLLTHLDPLQYEMFIWALDPGRVYFIKVDETALPPPIGGLTDNEYIGEARRILDNLRTRRVTGASAKTAAGNLMCMAGNALQQKWMARIINKDLQIGVDTQFHDLYPEAFDVFEPQLCKTWEDQDVDGWLYEVKWNGLRVLAVPNEAGVHGWYSRNGKSVPGMEALSEELAEAKMPGDGLYVFDGEGFGGDWDDQVGQSVSKIRGNKGHEDITLNAFDMIERSQWERIGKKGFKTDPLVARRATLEEFFRLNPGLRRIKLVQQGQIDLEAGVTPLSVRDDAISRAFEGVIMKNPQGHYHPGKHSNGWYKYKKRNPADLKIVGAVEGKKAMSGMLGAIVVQGEIDAVDKNGRPIGKLTIAPTEIGTGFTKQQRIDFWKEFLEGGLVGDTVEVEWGEITKDKKLFHTAFKRRRFDK